MEEGERQAAGGTASTGLKGWADRWTLRGKGSGLFLHQVLRLGLRVILRANRGRQKGKE